MRTRRTLLLGASAALGLSLAACSTAGPPGAADAFASLLQGGEWVVEEIDGVGIVERSRATLVFGSDGRLSGRASCNSYSAEYQLSGDGLTVGKTAVTRMACAPPLDVQEQRFLKALAATQRFELRGNDALRLLGADDHSISARRK